jgi:DNA polymerase
MDRPPHADGPATAGKSAAATLEILAQEVADCTRCQELATTRKQTVFADGHPRARLVFLGEAPGADEDAQGKPFVGRAGKLLTDMIERGMKLRREDVYIMNVLKCRPPGNRNPLPHEAGNCRRFLLRQLELVDPEFICCLGAVAAQNLLETTQPIGKLRGRFHQWRGIQVLCTYHPAYLLRNPDAKRPTWEDLQLLMNAMGLV